VVAPNTNRIRVRLLIAIPGAIVLLIVLMSGVFYWIADTHFVNAGGPFSPETVQDFAQDWFFFFLFFVVAGAVTGWALAYSMTRSIRSLIKLSQRIAAGDLTSKVEVDRTDEVGELGNSFNFMVESLHDFMETRNRFVLESFSGGLITVDVNGTITAMNSAAARMLNLGNASCLGKSLRHVLAGNGLDDLKELYKRAAWETDPLIDQMVDVKNDGESRRLSVNINPMSDSSGNRFGQIINFRDTAELASFYQQMRNTDRLATMGTFATGLAHEIRNPLGAIKGTAQLLAEDVKSNEQASRFTSIIVKEVNRLDALVREVQAYSQPAAQKEPVCINELVAEAVVLFRAGSKSPDFKQITLEQTYDDELPNVVLSRDKIVQVLLNILINAEEACPEKGLIRVETRFQAGESLPVLVRISNTGDPIPAEIAGKVFEPFFTTKSTGTGLGLSIAYQIVGFHKGAIDVKNSNGMVVFSIHLPAA
jgi:two-component system sensor histidine kinase AtoS